MSTEIVQKDPPPARSRGGKGNVSQRRQWMDAHPGEWLLYATVRHVSGFMGHLQSRGYEVTSRKQADGTSDLYARRPEGWKPEAKS